jgi:thiol-disulfide isomerase/thioredoxin
MKVRSRIHVAVAARPRPRPWPSGLLACALLACNGPSASPAPPSPSSAQALPSAVTPSAPLVLVPHDGIRWTQASAPLADVAPLVRDAIAKAGAEGRTLLVYVGATWCEPCQRFHHAVDQGELDAAFPRLSILAFDADRDAAALGAAGYSSRLIPLFAIPKSDGRSSGKQIEGSVKGEAAVNEITPRLRALVAGGP